MSLSQPSSGPRSELLFSEDELFRGLRTGFVRNLIRQLAVGAARVSTQTLTPTGILMEYGHYRNDEVTTNLLVGMGLFEKTANGRRFDPRAAMPVYVVSEGITPARILVVCLRPAADGGLSVGLGTLPLIALVPADGIFEKPLGEDLLTRH